jgi:hypothetical protein
MSDSAAHCNCWSSSGGVAPPYLNPWHEVLGEVVSCCGHWMSCTVRNKTSESQSLPDCIASTKFISKDDFKQMVQYEKVRSSQKTSCSLSIPFLPSFNLKMKGGRRVPCLSSPLHVKYWGAVVTSGTTVMHSRWRPAHAQCYSLNVFLEGNREDL